MTLFQGIHKNIANRHKCGDTFLRKIVLCCMLGDFFSKKGSLQQNIPFSENCVISWQFLAKKQKSQTKLLKKMESIVIRTLPLRESQEDSNGDNEMYYNYFLDFFFLYHFP